MLRHRLAALFKPETLLVLSHRALPVMSALPQALRAKSLEILVPTQGDKALPSPLPRPPGCRERLDVAVVCVQPHTLPSVLSALSALRPRAVVLLHAGQLPDNRWELASYCVAWARLNDCIVLGPNSLGLQRPAMGLNFSHIPRLARPGQVALVVNSDSLMAAVLDWADDISLGFSTVISLGDEAQLNVAQVLEYLATDPATDSIALYIDHVPRARELASALRAASSVKPVVVLRAMRGEPADNDTLHQAVLDALLRRAGVVRVSYFVQLFSAIKVLRYRLLPKGPNVAVFSNGRAAVHLAASVKVPGAVIQAARLAMATRRDLQALPGVQVDPRGFVIAEAALSAHVVVQIIQLLAQDAGVDGVLVLLAPNPLMDLTAVTHALVGVAPQVGKPIISCLMGEAQVRPLRHVLDEAGMPVLRTPESTAHAFSLLAAYDYNQRLSLQILPAEPLGQTPDLRTAQGLLSTWRQAGQFMLDEAACRQLLDCFHFSWQDFAPLDLDADGVGMMVHLDRDTRLGPYIWFGTTGRLRPTSDRVIELPPLNHELARQLIRRSPLWQGVLAREMTDEALEKLLDAMVCLSDMACELPALQRVSLSLRLLQGTRLSLSGMQGTLMSPDHMLAEWDGPGYRHMAIHPYPRPLVQNLLLRDGRPWVMRPIRPEDAAALQGFVQGLSDASRYMRFVYMLRELTPRMLARYTRIDYDREMALVATVQVPNPAHRGFPEERIVGLVHYFLLDDGRGAEFALVIDDDWQRHGLGSQLMQGAIEAAWRQGLDYLEGQVLANNPAMRQLLTRLGFKDDPFPDDGSLRRLWIRLNA